MDRGAWWAIVWGVAKSQTRLSLRSHMRECMIIYKNTFPPTVHKGPLSFTSLPTLVISCLLYISHSNRCEVISRCGCDVRFPGG